MSIQNYKTIQFENKIEFIEKKSRFIGYIKPLNSSKDAIDFITSIKSQHFDANHNVYAYIIKDENVVRYSDDGEPSGTAGIPVLDVLQKNNLTDVCVIVTRYFGGTLLGGGGLVRAYSHTAKLAVDNGNIINMQLCAICNLSCTYNQYGKISSLVPSLNGTITDTIFTDIVEITFNISFDDLNRLNKQLMEITCGEIQAEICDKQYFMVN